MRSLFKPLSIFIGVYLAIATLFSLAYDSNDYSSSDEQSTRTEELSANYMEKIEPVDTSTVFIDNSLSEQVLNDFIADAEKNGLDSEEVIEHIKTLDAIIIGDLEEYGLLGVTIYKDEPLSPTGMRGVIVINYYLLLNPDLYKLTLYHELGHWFGLDHCKCDGIMMDKYKPKKVQGVYEKWDKKVKKLMHKIDVRYDKKNDHYDFPDIPKKKDKKGKFKYIHEFGENVTCEHSH
jgi:hypothetical protein